MDYLYSANMMKDGSVVMCGSTSESLANTKSVSGHSDFVAVKLDSKGNHKWNWQVRARRCLDPLDQRKNTTEHVRSFVTRQGRVAKTLSGSTRSAIPEFYALEKASILSPHVSSDRPWWNV